MDAVNNVNIEPGNALAQDRTTEMALNWYALMVRSRHEFVASEQLRKQGIETFLPAVTRRRQWSDREKLVTFPLFPGYVFVHVRPNAEVFLQAVQTRGSVCFVCLETGRPTPIDPREMDALLLLERSGRTIDIYPHLCEGAHVAVKRGALAGAEGMIAQKDEKQQLLVNISILGRCLAVKVDAADLEAA